MDSFQHQALGGCGGSGFLAWSALEQMGKSGHRPAPVPHFQNRADQSPDHAPEETLAMEGEGEEPPLLLQRGCEQASKWLGVVAASGGKCGEVVAAGKHLERLSYVPKVRLRSRSDGGNVGQWRHDTAAIDPVSIRFAEGGLARVEVITHPCGRQQTYIWGKTVVAAVNECLEGHLARQQQVGYLAVRVHASIGATCTVERHRASDKLPERVFDFTLNAGCVDLALPARIVGSAVGDRQSVDHGSRNTNTANGSQMAR